MSGGTAFDWLPAQPEVKAMEARTITAELLRWLTDDRHLNEVRGTQDRKEQEFPTTAHEVEAIRDVMYRLWNAEHRNRA
jgi:hypothetical protein